MVHRFHVDIDPARMAAWHAGLGRVRNNLITQAGDVELVDVYLKRRLVAAIGKFGEDYVGEMSGRIDRIFELRNKLSGHLETVIGGETVHIDAIKQMFGELSGEIDQLVSPTKSLETQKLELPHEPPQPISAPKPAEPRSLLERATGREGGQIEAELAKVNPNIIKELTTAYPEEAALATVGLMVGQLPKLKTFWPIDAVRGLADMLRPETGITRALVERLLADLDSTQLSDLFQKFHSIFESENVRPGAKFLVDAELSTAQSVQLIDAYAGIKKAGLQLPQNMSRDSVAGLLKLVQENPSDFVTKLGDIPLEKRLSRLEALVKGPQHPATSALDQLVHTLSEDIHPGVNLLHGTSDDVVAAIEAAVTTAGRRFSEPSVRADFKRMVDRFRALLTDLQAGGKDVRNVIGQREEILAILAQLRTGGEVFSVGPVVKVNINPALFELPLFELPRGYRLENAPRDIPIQLDVGTRTVDGRLVVVETTSGELIRPEVLKGLDPESGLPSGGTIDFTQLDPRRASDRKFIQMIKLGAAAKYAAELAKAFQALIGSNAQIHVPEAVIRVSRISASARRVAEALGFRVEVTGGG
jgi:hypothetical protein